MRCRLSLLAALLLATVQPLRAADAPAGPHPRDPDPDGISAPVPPVPRGDGTMMSPADRALARAVVLQQLAGPGVPARQLEVTVTHGVVILEGQVPTLAQRERAADLALLTPGVRAVVDHLTLEPRVTPLLDLQQHCQQALALDPALQDLRVQVAVEEDGTAVLSGQVRSPADRMLALAKVMRQPGITAVVDGMTLGLQPPRGALLLTALQEVLGENVVLSQQPVEVHAQVLSDGSSVRLTGTVVTPLGIAMAHGLAEAAGAGRIETDLQVRAVPTMRTTWPDDAQALAAVHEVLRLEPRLAALAPRLVVTQGALVLNGDLHSTEVAALVDTLRHVAGVDRVVDAVIGGGVQSRQDRAALTRLVAALARDPAVGGRPVRIGFDTGTVEVAGTVSSAGERDWITVRCRQDRDVGAVDNHVVIDPFIAVQPYAPSLLPSRAESLAQLDRLWIGTVVNRSDAQVAREVQGALRSLGVPLDTVQVHCAHGVVSLDGQVANALERTLAQTGAVLAEPLAVENRLQVVRTPTG